MSKSQYTIVEYHSKQEGNRCGYCSSPNTSCSHGMTAQTMTVHHYQSLIDRGWRRSGLYCYKPMMKQTCCPHYTIKCNALEFKISRSQKKILKRMIKFLKGESIKDEQASRSGGDRDTGRNMEIPDYSHFTERAEQNASKMQVTSIAEEISGRLEASESHNKVNSSVKEPAIARTNSISEPMDTSSREERRANFDPSRGPQKKAKFLRIERKRNKLIAQGKTKEEIEVLMKKRKTKNLGKSLEDYFTEISNCSSKLELRLVRTSPTSDVYKCSAKESFELYKKYQMGIHNDKLFKLTEDRFTKFLVKSPLREWHSERDDPSQGYGSFHEQYWLNGTLIAVGVIDILPLCISSVYFFYDPAYSHLSLGTFSSLREVYLTRQLNKDAPNLKYYYMGFYIHSCPKMRYKAKMRPSELLCPETYVWCDIVRCLPKLDVSKYSRLNDDASAVDENRDVDIGLVLILFRKKVMAYGAFKTFLEDDTLEEEIKEYSSLVGKECASSMFYYIDD
ncbi:hypothetical protein QAD02_017473 [Eretmocerus hayati]|uniref:Uncharacterized protein n=1 Tax=Eretmocerus hayati TaxID=131215 RepID=A0ACC2PDY6_9HYME|nr:hypothetical protein QAD02_017473 [Eretmocerus hayati]